MNGIVAACHPYDTSALGGVPVPSDEEHEAMQRGQYILRAHRGSLTKVPVEKIVLENDPRGHPQVQRMLKGPGEVLYIFGGSLMYKSEDGGRSWSSSATGAPQDPYLQVMADGSFVLVRHYDAGQADGLSVDISTDEGRSWKNISRLSFRMDVPVAALHMLHRLEDDTLLCGVTTPLLKTGKGEISWLTEDTTDVQSYVSGSNSLYIYRSFDRGRTWSDPIFVTHWGTEGGMASRPGSNRVVMVARFQRPLLPGDPPELTPTGAHSDSYKNTCFHTSDDKGLTWSPPRLLTTLYGQCFGFPVMQNNGTVVVVHDTRYGPGPAGGNGRAMISRDEGKTWEDETYYMYYGTAITNYSQSVVLSDDTIVTVGGASDHPPGRYEYHACYGYADQTVIRWRPHGDTPVGP